MTRRSSVKLGLIQMRMQRDPEKNLKDARKLIQNASEKGAEIICLPELFNMLYFPQKKDSRPVAESIPGKTTNFLSSVAKENGVVLVGGSIYEQDGKRFYNTSVVFDDNGEMLGKYRKVHVPNDQSFYEQNYFTSGNEYHVFKTRYAMFSALICFDQWYPESARACRLMGADILFYPTAIGWVKGIEPAEGNWHEAWEAVQRGHAIANSTIVCAVNRVGVESDITFWGGSFVYDQFGSILFRANDKEGAFVVDCDLTLGKNVEGGWKFLKNRKPKSYSKLIE